MDVSWTIKRAEHRRIDAFKLALEKTLESPLDSKEIKPVHPKGNQTWIFTGRTDAEAPILWPPDAKSWLIGRPWSWERLKTGAEGDDRGWDGWMASPTWWTWVWASFGSWWWARKPGVLQSMGSQRVRDNTEWLNCNSGSKMVFWKVMVERTWETHTCFKVCWESWIFPMA